MTSSPWKSFGKRGAAATLLAAGAVLGGVLTTAIHPARAEVRETTSREAFQAGDERNTAILREIAATLEKIESRVARIEAAALRTAENPKRPVKGAAR